MKLYQVEYLLAVGKCGSISKAADELLVSRPAVSRAIKDLEDEFGITFFLRTTTGVILTEAGQVVYEKCKKIEQLFSELQTEVSALKGISGNSGDRQLHIGVSFTSRLTVLPFIAAFRTAYPDIALRMSDLEDAFIDSGTLVPDYDLEIALAEDMEYDGIDSLDIFDSSFVFCCNPSHPLADRSHVSVTEIKDEPLGSINHLEQKGNQVTTLFSRYGLKPNVVSMTQQVSFLQQMVHENLCSIIVPRQSVGNDPGVVCIPIDEAPKLYLRILWNNEIRHNSAFQDFIHFARQKLPGFRVSMGLPANN